MTIRTRLTLLFTVIVSALLGLFCCVIYYVSERYRQDEFHQRLREEALTSAELLFGRETISPELFRLLDKNQMTVLPKEEIIIYNYRNQVIYESGTDYLKVSKATLDRVRLAGDVYWREDEREVAGAVFSDRYNRLVVFASAVDVYGFRKQRRLAVILTTGWLVATLVVFGAGRFFAGRSLRPLQRIIRRIDAITASQLSLRLDEGPDADELAQLASRFNRMLDRLEDAFRMQRAFVSNASHELRTPLTAITGQLEVSLLADDDPDELRTTIRSVLDDIRGLNRMTNGLLSLAKVSMDESAVALGPVALDELLWQVRSEVMRLHPDYVVTVSLDALPAPLTTWTLTGNEPLLRTALFNLLENGGKFSPDHRVTARLTARMAGGTATTFQLAVHNNGPAIPAAELPDIFKPFRRGSNARSTAGHGIGLSLTERIIRLHHGRISVTSDERSGTTFALALPQAP